jgi:hypothetical protein
MEVPSTQIIPLGRSLQGPGDTYHESVPLRV